MCPLSTTMDSLVRELGVQFQSIQTFLLGFHITSPRSIENPALNLQLDYLKFHLLQPDHRLLMNVTPLTGMLPAPIGTPTELLTHPGLVDPSFVVLTLWSNHVGDHIFQYFIWSPAATDINPLNTQTVASQMVSLSEYVLLWDWFDMSNEPVEGWYAGLYASSCRMNRVNAGTASRTFYRLIKLLLAQKKCLYRELSDSA